MHWSQIRYRGNRRVLVRRKRDSFDNFGTRGRYITTWVHQSPHRYTQMHSNPIRIRGIGSLSLSFSPTIPFVRHSSNFANDSALIMHRARSCKFVILSFLFFLLPLYRLSLLLLSFSSLSLFHESRHRYTRFELEVLQKEKKKAGHSIAFSLTYATILPIDRNEEERETF